MPRHDCFRIHHGIDMLTGNEYMSWRNNLISEAIGCGPRLRHWIHFMLLYSLIHPNHLMRGFGVLGGSHAEGRRWLRAEEPIILLLRWWIWCPSLQWKQFFVWFSTRFVHTKKWTDCKQREPNCAKHGFIRRFSHVPSYLYKNFNKALQVSSTAHNISGAATLVMCCFCLFHCRRLVLAKKGDFTRKATPLCPGMATYP